MLNKNIILAAVLFLVIILIVFLLFFSNLKPGEQPISVPIYNPPTPTSTISPLTTQTEQEYYQSEINYAKAREQYLKENPWVLKMPLKSDSYFISYDPENNRFLATIYYYPNQPQTQLQQTEKAKQLSVTALQSVGANVKQGDIIYIVVNK